MNQNFNSDFKLCVWLSVDRVYPGSAHISSSSNVDDATFFHLWRCEMTYRRSTEEGEKREDKRGLIITSKMSKISIIKIPKKYKIGGIREGAVNC